MTIRLLCAYDKYPANAIVTLDAGTEAGLIAAKQATATLTGGDAYFVPVQPLQQAQPLVGGGRASIKAGEQVPVSLPEGQALTVTGAAGTVGTLVRTDAAGTVQPAVTIGASSFTTPAYPGTQKFLISCAAGGVDVSVVAASVPLANAVGGKNGAEFVKQPWGAHGYLNNSGIMPYTAIGYGRGKLVGFSQNAECWVYKNAAWTKTLAYDQIARSQVSSLTLAANGYLYAGFNATPALQEQGKLYRSVDDGATWTSVFQIPNPTTSNPCSPRFVVESETGVLFCSFYPTGLPNVSVYLIKSTDNGATWTDITASLAQAPERHIHGIHYCPYRKLLFLYSGDTGAASKVQVSSDLGVTWTLWPASVQTTAMTTDERYLYLQLDNGNDRQILRVDCPLHVNPAKANLESVIVYETPEKSVAGGFAWWGAARNGLVYFIYGAEGPARIVASSNWGEPGSWEVVYDHGMGAMSLFTHSPVGPTRYAEGLFDGVYYGLDTRLVDRMSSWTIGAKNAVLQIDQVNGKQTNNGFTAARRYLNGLEQGRFSPMMVKTVADSVITSRYDVTFEGDTGALTVDTTAGVTQNLADTALPKSGTRSGSFGYGAASGLARSRVKLPTRPALTTAGQTHWVAADIRLEGGLTPLPLALISLENSAGGYIQVVANTANNDVRITSSDNVALTNYVAAGKSFTPGVYRRLKMRITFGRTAVGRITVWLDREMILDVDNVQTVIATGDINGIYLGLSGTVPGMTAYIDNFVYAQNGDPGD